VAAALPGHRKVGNLHQRDAIPQPEKFETLARSALDNISIGIDSVDPQTRSKPLSPVGVEGVRLLEQVVVPLAEAWTGRFIKLDVVFHGDKRQTLDVIRAGRRLGLNVSVVELNGVMANVTDREMRSLFLELIAETAAEFSLEAKLYEPLNEIYLLIGPNKHRSNSIRTIAATEIAGIAAKFICACRQPAKAGGPSLASLKRNRESFHWQSMVERAPNGSKTQSDTMAAARPGSPGPLTKA